MSAGGLTDAPWEFADAETRALFDKIRASCARELRDAAEIFVGVQTSADKTYVFKSVAEGKDTLTLSWNGRDWPIERGILRRGLLDSRVHPYRRAEPDVWVIFPYEIIVEGTGPKARQRARLIQPDEMQNKYPDCFAYLTARRAELESRNIMGGVTAEKQFYQFGRSQGLTKFDSPKVIVRVMAREARYAYDKENHLTTAGGNGPYYNIRPIEGAPETNYFILAVLHHPLSEAMIRTNTSTFQGGYYSHGKQYIERLPIPPATNEQRAEVEGLVGQLLDANDKAITARIPRQKQLHERNAQALRDQIETLIGRLFGLTDDEMSLVKAVPIPA